VALAVVELQQTREAICSAIERRLYIFVGAGLFVVRKVKKVTENVIFI
jgi:prefoldin subunit 5